MRPLKLAIPNKGRLSEETIALLRRAGMRLDSSSERQLFATTLGGRVQVLFLRAADIPGFVADGTVDAGITGRDVVLESGRALVERLDLEFGACRLVVAVPDQSQAASLDDLPGEVRVATSFPNLARRHFEAAGKKVHVVHVSGACEVAPRLGVADVIVDLTSTGSTMLMNHLHEIDTILSSTSILVTGTEVEPALQARFDAVLEALRSVVAARGKRYLMADIPRSAVDAVRAFLPGLAGPTVVDIAGDRAVVAIQVVVDEDDIFDAVGRLKALGGRGILIVPIDRMVA